eukprot:4590019-Lingulodinium_polyedra.AAC.1
MLARLAAGHLGALCQPLEAVGAAVPRLARYDHGSGGLAQGGAQQAPQNVCARAKDRHVELGY